MKIGNAKHIESGKQVEFMHYTKGNYRETLEWYEQDTGRNVVYHRDEIDDGDGFSYYTLECERELINTNWYLIKWGRNDHTAVCPRDFKEWFEVTNQGEPLTQLEAGL